MARAQALAVHRVQRRTTVLALDDVVGEQPGCRGCPLAAHAAVQPLAAPSCSSNDCFSPGPVRAGEELRVSTLDWQASDRRIDNRQDGTEGMQRLRHHTLSRGWAARAVRPSNLHITRNTIGARRDRFQRRFLLTGPPSLDAGDGTTNGMQSCANRNQGSGWLCLEDELWCWAVMR